MIGTWIYEHPHCTDRNILLFLFFLALTYCKSLWMKWNALNVKCKISKMTILLVMSESHKSHVYKTRRPEEYDRYRVRSGAHLFAGTLGTNDVCEADEHQKEFRAVQIQSGAPARIPPYRTSRDPHRKD